MTSEIHPRIVAILRYSPAEARVFARKIEGVAPDDWQLIAFRFGRVAVGLGMTNMPNPFEPGMPEAETWAESFYRGAELQAHQNAEIRETKRRLARGESIERRPADRPRRNRLARRIHARRMSA